MLIRPSHRCIAHTRHPELARGTKKLQARPSPGFSALRHPELARFNGVARPSHRCFAHTRHPELARPSSGSNSGAPPHMRETSTRRPLSLCVRGTNERRAARRPRSQCTRETNCGKSFGSVGSWSLRTTTVAGVVTGERVFDEGRQLRHAQAERLQPMMTSHEFIEPRAFFNGGTRNFR